MHDTGTGFLDTLRHEFRRLRKQRRLSQSEVGEMIHVGQTAVAGFENARTTLRPAALDRAMALVEQWQSEEEEEVDAPTEGELERQTAVSPPVLVCDMRCPDCGSMVPGPRQNAIFCCYCGETLGKECRGCGHLNTEEEAMFCSACGEPLTEDAARTRRSLDEAMETPSTRRLREEILRVLEEVERKRNDEPEV